MPWPSTTCIGLAIGHQPGFPKNTLVCYNLPCTLTLIACIVWWLASSWEDLWPSRAVCQTLLSRASFPLFFPLSLMAHGGYTPYFICTLLYMFFMYVLSWTNFIVCAVFSVHFLCFYPYFVFYHNYWYGSGVRHLSKHYLVFSLMVKAFVHWCTWRCLVHFLIIHFYTWLPSGWILCCFSSSNSLRTLTPISPPHVQVTECYCFIYLVVEYWFLLFAHFVFFFM